MRYILLLSISLFFSLFVTRSSAQSINEQFCLQKMATPNDVIGISDVIEFENYSGKFFYLGKMPRVIPAVIEGDDFKELKDEFPKYVKRSRFVETPDGKVMGLQDVHGSPTPIYQLNKQTGTFDKVHIEGSDQIYNVSQMKWSTPLNGIVVSTQGIELRRKEHRDTVGLNPNPSAVFLLKKNRFQKVEGIEGWVTRIVDLPELGLTFLGTEREDRIYLIDKSQKVHFVGKLNLGKWIFFSHVYHLKNPDRLLVRMQEAMGPYRGMFIIDLEKKSEITTPKKHQNLTDIWLPFNHPSGDYPMNNIGRYSRELNEYLLWGWDYTGVKTKHFGIFTAKKKNIPTKLYRVGNTKFEEVPKVNLNGEDNTLYTEFLHAIRHPSVVKYIPSDGTRKIKIGKSNLSAILTKEGVYVEDQQKKRHLIANINGFVHSQYSQYLKENKALFIHARDGFYLLKDRSISGDCEKKN